MARILHVEGDGQWRDLVRAMLVDHHVDTVASANETLRLLEIAAIYDIALVDMTLFAGSDSQGGMVLDLLRERCPSTRRIVMTGRPPGGSIRRNIFERYDVDEIIIKSDFDIPDLRMVVEDAIGRGPGGLPQELRMNRSALRQRFRDWQRIQSDRLRFDIRQAEEHLYDAAKVSPKTAARAQRYLDVARSNEASFRVRSRELGTLVGHVENSYQLEVALAELDAAEEFFDNLMSGQDAVDMAGNANVQVPDKAAPAKADFFISYAQSDQAWAEWVAWEIEESGYRVLIQAWETHSGRDRILSIHEGVENASHTLAILSPAYLASEFASAEWQAAWARDPDGEKRKLIPLRVAECERPGLLSVLVGIDLFGQSEAAARSRLLSAAKRLAGSRNKPATRPAFPPAGRSSVEREFPGILPRVWNVPARDPGFTGRRQLLQNIKDTWGEIGKVSVQVLRGPGGIGKTMTAVEYAHRFAADYEIVWWVNAEDQYLLDDQLAALAGPLGLVATAGVSSRVPAVRSELRRRGGWLLIFDDATGVKDLGKLIPSGPGHVLVTTRGNGLSEVGIVSDVDVLDRVDSIDVIKGRIPTFNNDQASRLASELGDHPLAMAQAAAYIDESRISLDDYIGLFRSRESGLLKRGVRTGQTYPVAAIWSVSAEALRASQPAAVELLELCAWLAPEPIPLDLFSDHPERLPEHLAVAAADPLSLADTVKAVVDYGLARRSGNGILLHRLVQDTVRDDLGTSTDGLTLIAALLRVGLPQKVSGAPQNWPRWRQLLPHVLAVTGRYNE